MKFGCCESYNEHAKNCVTVKLAKAKSEIKFLSAQVKDLKDLNTEAALQIAHNAAEIECLRSVLSEWDQDKSCYVQWMNAEQLRIERTL